MATKKANPFAKKPAPKKGKPMPMREGSKREEAMDKRMGVMPMKKGMK